MADYGTDVYANNEFYYSNVSPITTNFNVNPYYDDFDDGKNYHRILFKPGFSVQSRELTQIQSMLQDQIQKFGQHMFKEGSMVLGGKYNIDFGANYIKVGDKDTNGNDVDISLFQNQVVTGQVTGIQATVNLVLDGAEGTDKPKTLYVTYSSGNANTGEVVFAANEPLIANVGTLVVGNTAPTGLGTIFTINEGVRFCKQHFIHHTKQTVAIDRYGTNPTCKVGFVLTEQIVDASQDATLLDPALESSNYAAPGADRFKIIPTLTRLEIDDPAAPPNYVNLFIIRNSNVSEVAERPTYNIVNDELARRTSDESGDYYVSGFNVVVKEHLNNGTNDGYLKLDQGGDSNLLAYQIEKGKAYVKGYEINTNGSTHVIAEKATTYANINGQIVSSKLGNYVTVKEAVGAWNLNLGTPIDLYNTAQARVSSGVGSVGGPTGTKIGTAKVKSLSRGTSGSLGTANGEIRVHLMDVNMLGTNAFSSVRSVFKKNVSTANVVADVVLSSGSAVIKESTVPLLYHVGSTDIKNIRSYDGTVDTSFSFKRTKDVTITSGGTFAVSETVDTEFFPYGSTTLSSADKQDIFLTINESFDIAILGTTVSGGGTKTLTGTSTQFTRLNVGDKLRFSGTPGSVYVINNITSDTVLTVTQNLPTLASDTMVKVYTAGDMIDLSGVGYATGAEREVVATSSSLTFDLKESLVSSRSGTVSYTVSRSSAREVAKHLKLSRYIKINCGTHPNGLTGPYDIGFSDVFKVKNIWSKASDFSTSSSEGTNVTSDFEIDDGQRNDFYGHGYVTPKAALASGTYLLVELDYFQPDYTLGVGYFSVDSYPINDVNTLADQITTAQIPLYNYSGYGIGFDLRNYLDFRPVYVNTAADATTVAGATTNPTAAPTTFQSDSNGLRIPAESQPVMFDYQKYLGRIDIVAVDVRGQFRVIKGAPSTKPVTPVCPEELMSCARVYVSPYPSISPNYASILRRPDLACYSRRTSYVRYTMRDIGVIKQRVDNLENYVSLSLLEKAAADLKILDENGNDRFKNGIFVDTFTSFATSDAANPDHHICYDPKEGSLRPICDVAQIGYDVYSNTNSVQVGNLVLLPHTEETIAEQPYATTFRNVETTVYKFLGKLFLSPDADYWVNTERLNAQKVYFGPTDEDITPYSVVYGAYESNVTGVTKSEPVLVSSTKVDNGWVLVGNNTTVISPAYSTSSIEPDFFVGWRLVERNYAAVTKTDTTYNNYVTTNDTYNYQTYTTTQLSRSMQETFQSIQTETHSLGDKVVNVAPIADIRPQTITLHAKGLKASTKHFVYFDGVLMNDYITPAAPALGILGVPSSLESSIGAITMNKLLWKDGTEGDKLYSDEDGNLYAILRLPADGSKTFRTGTKEVVVTDSPTNDKDATSAAMTHFYSQGTTQYKQDTVMSTGTIVTEVKNGIDYGPSSTTAVLNYANTSNTQLANVKVVTKNSGGGVSVNYPLAWMGSCMAYSFKLVSLYGDEGMFLSSVDVYFAGKDPVKGVWFEIRAMNNAGNITTVQVPYSEVFMTTSEVNVSDDGSVATNVKFKVPVFLMNNTEYAFVIHTQGINPNYYMYVSVLGDNDIITKKPVNERPLTGTLFTTNNNTDWDAVPRVDLKVKFNRAVFDTNVIGEVVLGNQTREFIELPDPGRSSANTSWFGEMINGNDTLGLSSPSRVIIVGDRVIGQTSGVNTSVVSISGGNYKVSGTGYTAGETVSFANANGTVYGTVTSTVLLKTTPTGEIYSSKSKLNVSNTTSLVLKDSNGLFTANDILTGILSSNTSSVGTISKYVYATTRFEPRYIDFNRTYLDFAMSTRSNTGIASDYIAVPPSTNIDYDNEMAIYSRSTEIGSYGSVPSNRVKVSLSTTSDYLSPVLDVGKTYSIYHRNLINANTAGETNASGGGLKNKYISQVVTLADGQDAEDLRIILSAYRPPSSNSDFIVYVRVSNAEDFEPIWQRQWIEVPLNSSVYSSLSNRKDWREYNFKLPSSMYSGTNDLGDPIVGYTNSVGTTFSGFKQFQIKIGLKSDSSAIFPRIADLRAIALQL
jgi:hypothetical protein